ncbi:ABC transporter ATP-binding protein [Aquipseudomonas alcaligenes]|uniref:ABC transporter ATP-binding protein n=1 Tax=Aquipseudomonas alcaligenes TaxID=43263 RepID=A0A2V4LWX3_AQUAC|nr:ABC transporter ATP-binding protein [Pseudomonas alcaligenes]PYC25617.1 ABC transporter ATP-binding protein [Pseudomonas alcaligenes]
MCSEVVIRVESLSKCYQIYDKPRDRLKQFIFPYVQKLFGFSPKKYYEEFWASRDVSFTVRKGETLCVMGYNGSGKSTLLQMICGTLNPSSGLVEVSGRVAALLELGSGFNLDFTGRENVYISAAILGLTRNEIDARFDKISEFAAIGSFMDQPVRNYSSGMYVRLAFSIIANVDADILIIDEALAVGDVKFTQKCMRFLRDFKSIGTLIFVSHDLSAVLSLCDSAIWLDNGRIKASGDAKYVTEHYLADIYNAPLNDNDAGCNDSAVTMLSNAASASGLLVFSEKYDMRMRFINCSNLRNDLKVFDFVSDSKGFGHGGASFSDVFFLDNSGNHLSWIVGGECVSLLAYIDVHTKCNNLVVGFQLKNKLGQVVFAKNTFGYSGDNSIAFDFGSNLRVMFKFNMPILPIGHYSIDVAVADGVPPDVKQLQWVHDALIIESRTSSVVSGLVGLPFEEISIEEIKVPS